MALLAVEEAEMEEGNTNWEDNAARECHTYM